MDSDPMGHIEPEYDFATNWKEGRLSYFYREPGEYLILKEPDAILY